MYQIINQRFINKILLVTGLFRGFNSINLKHIKQ
jgi:hypothetical protein